MVVSGSISSIFSLHSIRVTPSGYRKSSPPIDSNSSSPLRRYKSRWYILYLPSYSCTNVKVGLTIASVMFKPSAKPFAKTVFPAPKEPLKEITEPLGIAKDSFFPSSLVSFSLLD